MQSNNQLNYTSATAVTDFKTVVNDFTGMPLYSKVTKKRTSADTVSVYTSITYDQVYRVTGISQKYNTGLNNPVAGYNYNELGQLVLKNLGYISPGSWLQNEDFRYDIHGWLLSINNSKLTPDGGKTNTDINDVFGMQLMYNKTDSALTNTVMFNGKPTGVKWMTRSNNVRTKERSFLFNYGGFDHYLGETYAERDTASIGASPYNRNRGMFNETGINYDAGGNLTKLSRRSSNAAGGIIQIDTLAYAYSTTNPNLLLSVTDGTDTVHTNHGFRSIDSTANYEYDANGNLYNDHFKGMQLRYNVLNRTDKINITTASGQFIDYTYDADGNLLRKRAYTGGTLQTTTDYIDGFVYITITTGIPALSYFPMPEGRVVNVGGTPTQEFIMTDQQGNARVAFRNVSGVLKVYQENSYYGTGLILPNSAVSTPAVANKKLYNGGSEWQNDSASGTYNLPDYYQTYNRNYDAAIGRFIGVDPQAESAESLNSYQYAGCNPILNNDPNGGRFGTPQYQNNNVNEFNQPGSGTNLGSLYGDVAGVTGVPSFDNGMGLYYNDPAAYWSLYAETNGTFGGNLLFHRSNGPGDPTIGINVFKNGVGIPSISGDDLTFSYKKYYAVTVNGFSNTEGYDIVTRSIDLIDGDANAGGMAPPGLLGGQSNPASWVFTPAGPDANYQTAGVSGILFHELKLEWDPKEMGVKAAIVIMRPLYFELPRVTSMFGKTDEIMSSVWAAVVSAGAVNAAIRAADKAWDNSDGELNQYQLGNIFLQSLRTIIQSVGGRVSTQPNYPLTIVRPYSTL